MTEKKVPPSVSLLQSHFYALRKDIAVDFGKVSELLVKNQDTDLAWLALAIGKFLVWHAPNIDGNSAEMDAALIIKIPTAKSVGLIIQAAAIATLEGKNIQICNRHFTTGLDGVNSRLERLEKFLMKEAA